MLFCEIIPRSLPVLKHACNADFRAYRNFFPNYYSNNLLEICVCQEGRMIRAFPGGATEMISPGMLVSVFKDDVFEAYAFQQERQRHTTIGIAMDYDIKRWDSEKKIDLDAIQKRVEEKGHILVPCTLKLGEQLDNVTHMMQRLIYTYASGTAACKTQTIGEWFGLIAYLTAIVLKELGVCTSFCSAGAERYIRKATTYIQSNYTQKLTLETIAKHTGISAGHLSRIFREVKGISVLDYVNQYRISLLMTIAARYRYSLKEASYAVGFDDPSYASRLFKKITGMTYRQFLIQCNEKEDTESSL